MYLVSPKHRQVEIDRESLAVAREIVRRHTAGEKDKGEKDKGVRHILELAYKALPQYSEQAVSMCMLALLGSHPDYEAGQQPPRSLHASPPFHTPESAKRDEKPSPAAIDATTADEPLAAAPATTDDGSRWSDHEMNILLDYVAQNPGKKSWIALASTISAKTPTQCCNKYRALRRYKKI
ncbi:hypothetical protein GGI21_005254 [Coemansia aciculifera]|nr:hypothetical protein GGI21_005254 [Coemansia aciculifera]